MFVCIPCNQVPANAELHQAVLYFTLHALNAANHAPYWIAYQ
jgi:hypothetical protein